MQHQKITDADIARYGMVSQPDRMTGTVQENKAAFDRLVRDCVRVQFNALSDDLADSSCAASLGAADGTVQSSLDGKARADDLLAHTQNAQNPHGVTKAQVGLSAVADERQYSAQNPPPYPVASVSLDGTPLVPDAGHNVDLPVTAYDPSSGKAAYGLVRGSQITGVYFDREFQIGDTKGYLRIFPAQDSHINLRKGGVGTDNNLPITGENLDYAVRAAMCDGEGEAWSESEKTAARARLGIGSETLTHLGDLTTQHAASPQTSWSPSGGLRTFYCHLTLPAMQGDLRVDFFTETGTPHIATYKHQAGKTGELMIAAELRCGRLHVTAAQKTGGEVCPVPLTPAAVGAEAASEIGGIRLTYEGEGNLPDGITATFDGIGVSV